MLQKFTGLAPDSDFPSGATPNGQEARSSLDALQFDNRFVNELPGDPDLSNRRRQVEGACYSRVLPTPVRAPKLLACSQDMARRLGLTKSELASERFARIFAGNELLPGMAAAAACYGGHQFGSWAGQLGDGRAISMGEVLNAEGERWELQLKGAGPTPYSRRGDGRAVLRSSVREFLCSEAMFYLGIPTTRALSVVLSGEGVERDMFYDGHPRIEPGAIVCRAAPSFLRFGNFELFAQRNDATTLRKLVEFAIRRDFPELGAPNPEIIVRWLESVAQRTAIMIIHWMRVGFVHGVMNTDNMSILGLTIDYGPYGWLDHFDLNFTPNTTDAQGRRYRFGNQPRVALWNLVQLTRALTLLDLKEADLDRAVGAYADTLNREYPKMSAGKLGLSEARPGHEGSEQARLIADLPELLATVETDMTLFYRALAEVPIAPELATLATDRALLAPLMSAYYAPAALPDAYCQQMASWLRRYVAERAQEPSSEASQIARMQALNPSFILRNYLVQEAIEKAEQGDFSRIIELLLRLEQPYASDPADGTFCEKRPEWARQRAGCSMLSCSS